MSSSPTPVSASWGDLLKGKNGIIAGALMGGVALHAINVHIVTTVLPSVVNEIGGLSWYAWNTTLFVVASIIGAALSVRLLGSAGPRGACITALIVFALGSAACASAASMPWMLVGRSVQGLGGGALAALSYALIPIVFAQRLWSRAVALVSGMWGVATLSGPAVGGLFAQAGHWRWAFWFLLPACLLQGCLIAMRLRATQPDASAQQERPTIPVLQIVLLASSVLTIAAAGLFTHLIWQAAGVLTGLVLGMAALAADRHAHTRLLPRGSIAKASPLGAIYACIALLMIGTTSEIYVPYFLQTLHDFTPLQAGYLTAAMAAGWSIGSLFSAGQTGTRALFMMRIGPVLGLSSLLALAALIPTHWGMLPAIHTTLCLLALAGVGAGVGIGWPHLLTRVLTLAPTGEGGIASAAITTIQLYGLAIGAALAGLLANAAGVIEPGGQAGAQSAAAWLFATFALAPLLALLPTARITRA